MTTLSTGWSTRSGRMTDWLLPTRCLRPDMHAGMQAVGITYQAVFERMMQINWPSRITRDKAIAFVQALIRKRRMENTDVLEYTDMARNYFAIKLGEKYRAITKPLLEAGILQSTNYYRPGWENEFGEYIKGQCLSYRINPKLLTDDMIQILYEDKKKHQKCRDEVTMASKQILRQLRIPSMNSREIIKFVKRTLTDDRIRKMLKVGDEICDDVINLKTRDDDRSKYLSNAEGEDQVQDMNGVRQGKWRIRHVKLERIRNIYQTDNGDCTRRRRVLIQDGKYCYLDFLDDYIGRKRRHLTQAYCDQLLRIKHRNVYADRNETNLRLDSNITNLKSDYLSLLTMDDQRLSQVDLKNSQFRFFIMLLEQCERQVFGARINDFPLGLQMPDPQKSEVAAKLEIKEKGIIEGKQVTLLCVLIDQFCLDKSGATTSFAADYKLFKKLGKTGQLYEYIQKIYWDETGKSISRAEAKKLMFTIAFASHKYWPEGKNVLHSHFPSIIRLIDGFKVEMIRQYALNSANKGTKIGYSLISGLGDPQLKESDGKNKNSKVVITAEDRQKGNASFAIMLQQTESLVFIDRILARCHNKGIKALSKHDSIVCRQCDTHKVTKIICKVLNQLFGRFSYSLDIDGKVFELREKKKSRMGRFVDTFMHTLFGIANRANAPPINWQSRDTSDSYTAAVDAPEKYNIDTAHQELGVGQSTTLSPRIAALRKKLMGY